jgi:hypothetical protein
MMRSIATTLYKQGPLGFERGPHGDCIATSANFYATTFSFFETYKNKIC